MFVYAYDGMIAVDYIDKNGNVRYEVSDSLPPVKEKTRFIDDMITLGENTVIILGSNEALPCTIMEKQDTAEIHCFEGIRFTEQISTNALIDSLDDKCFALSYFQTENFTDIHLATRVGCIEKKEEKVSITLTEELLYSKNYIFHGIAGLSSNAFVLAKAVNEDQTDKDLHFQVATIKDGKIKVGHEITLLNRTNFGFFDMDK